jgi:hypothetical protein
MAADQDERQSVCATHVPWHPKGSQGCGAARSRFTPKVIARSPERAAQACRGTGENAPARSDDAPFVGSDLNGTPALVDKIKVDSIGMLGNADVHRLLGPGAIRSIP